MPALPAAPGVIRVTIPMGAATDPNALCRIFTHYSGTAPTSAQLKTFCDAVSSAWLSNITPLQSAVWTQFPIQCEDLSTATGAVAQGTTSNPGVRSGHSLPASNSLMVQFLIARRYRGGKPKIFLPVGVAEDLATGPTWSTSFLTATSTGFQAFIAAVNAAGWAAAGTLTHVNVSYFQGFTSVQNPVTHRWRNVPTVRGAVVVDPITAYGVEVGIASQRRRNNV